MFEKDYSFLRNTGIFDNDKQYLKKAWRGLNIIFWIWLIAIAVVFMLCSKGFIKFKYFIFIVCSSFYASNVYICLFPKVIDYDWKKNLNIFQNIVSFIYVFVFLISFVAFLNNISPYVNIIEGKGKAFLFGSAVVILISIISYFRINLVSFKESSILIYLILIILIASGNSVLFTDSVIYATHGKPVHYDIQSIEVKKAKNKTGTSYFANVVMPDGTKKQMDVFSLVYDDYNNGSDLVLCEYESIFGIKAAMIHEK